MSQDDILMHYGTKHHSGRYPYGSGEIPYQHEPWFHYEVASLRKEGLTDAQIAEKYGITQFQMRTRISLAKEQQQEHDRLETIKLREKGWSYSAISERLGVSEGTVRNYMKPKEEKKKKTAESTAAALVESLKETGYVDVGAGVEIQMGVGRQHLRNAIKLLEEDGYHVMRVPVEQITTGHETTVLVLGTPEANWSTAKKNPDLIKPPVEYSNDGGKTYEKIQRPAPLSSSRVMVQYGEEGKSKDGMIEIRRGVDDISLGDATYAQVRINVDGTHYLKGMAVYADDLPKGVDIRFNTKEVEGTPMLGEKGNTVLKPLKSDPDNPFGATIKKQRKYIGEDGKEHLSPINIVNEEGDWKDGWSRNLSSQFLSKQTPELAKKQLTLARDIKQDTFDEIMSLTNPVLKKQLLTSFADECDSAAVHLKAAAMPRQGWHAILPLNSLGDNEIYAPNFKDGERVVLVRYPHAGRFEIPELVVNNKNPDGRRILGDTPKDAVGINSKTAAKLSGADFDGDTVLVIPNNSGKVKTAPSLKGLKDFDPEDYHIPTSVMTVGESTGFRKQIEMGSVSNLITDMTIKGASQEEIARAVRHSMVVIDAEKHNLDWRKSAEDNQIAKLKERYQGSARSGASTLISKASSEIYVDEREPGRRYIDPKTGKKRIEYFDPETGEKYFHETERTYNRPVTKTVKDPVTGEKTEVVVWEQKKRQTTTSKMYEAKDARELSSGYQIEEVYASYANDLKEMGRKARIATTTISATPYSPAMAKAYSKEVASLREKLKKAQQNAPLERQANIIAKSKLRAVLDENPGMDKDDIKKKRGQLITWAREQTGASKQRIQITDREWEAIQKGALHKTSLEKIFSNTDQEQLKRLAMPRTSTGLSSGQIARAKAMIRNGYTQADVADALGVSVSTVLDAIG